MLIPTEAEEQATVLQYCDLKGYKYFHVPNSTHTLSHRQRSFNRSQGLRRGVPDLFIVLPEQVIAIEMKRFRGSVTSSEQKEWIDTLNNANLPARVCKGAKAAIEFIEEMANKKLTNETEK